MALHQEYGSVVTLMAVDEDFVEVRLSGSWIAEDKDAHEGMCLMVMSDRIKRFIYKLWQMGEAHISSPA